MLLAWAGCAVLGFVGLDVAGARTFRATDPDRVAATGRVLARDDVLQEVAVAYTNPVTGQALTLDVYVRRDDLRPEVGDEVSLAVVRGDPRAVRIDGDDAPWHMNLLVYLPWVVVPAAWFAMRWRTIHRAAACIESAAPTFAMSGAIVPPRRGRRRPRLALYALDAAPGAAPVCTVPLLSAEDVPPNRLFRIEVKGTPRAGALVVARVGAVVLWPSGRAAARGDDGRPGLHVDDVGSIVDVAAPAAHPTTSFVVLARLPLVLLALGALLVPAMGVVTLVQRSRSITPGPDTVELFARIESREDTSVIARVEWPDGSATSVELPAALPEEYDRDTIYPVLARPTDRAHARFVREPYDMTAPLVWSAVPMAVAAAWTVLRYARWRAGRRVARTAPRRRVTLRDVGPHRSGRIVSIARAADEAPFAYVVVQGSQALPQPLAGRLASCGHGGPAAVAVGAVDLPVLSPLLAHLPFDAARRRSRRPGPRR